MRHIKRHFLDAVRSILMIAPMLLAVIALVGLFQVIVTPEMLHTFFTGHVLYDTVIGTFTGAVSIGQPFISYIIGGELLKDGISYFAVTAFIIAWVTLGLIQLPLETSIFGKRFTLIRNTLAFFFAFIVAVATTLTMELFI